MAAPETPTLSTIWHARRRSGFLLDGGRVRAWTGHESWPEGRRVAVHADPWQFGIRQVRREITAARLAAGESGRPNPLDQLDRLTRLDDGQFESTTLTLAEADGGDGQRFLGFAALARRLRRAVGGILRQHERTVYEIDLMFLWVQPECRRQGLGAALASMVGITALEDYRSIAGGRERNLLPVSTLLFADFLTAGGAAVGRLTMHALVEAGLAFVTETAGADMTLRLKPPRLVTADGNEAGRRDGIGA
jgi:GNAT superfamily N-acetyltransferase